jgi:CubicO group peptidase (beta-lactamase class C family)
MLSPMFDRFSVGGCSMADPQHQAQILLDQLTESGAERGLQVAAYFEGECVVDAWSGLADPDTDRAVDGDTLFTIFSVGKGVAATAAHILAEHGLLDYDAPVCRYWPEFGVHGKAAITVRQVLCHTAGIPQLPDGLTIAGMCDWDHICSAIAQLEPIWEPGTRIGYHATTWGFLVGELIHRAGGRPFQQVVIEEICRPLDISTLFFGIPEGAASSVAQLEAAEPSVAPAPLPPDSLLRRVMGPVPRTPAIWNRPDIRCACIPAAGGVMNAHAIARHYAALIGTVDRVRLLTPERLQAATTLQVQGNDVVLGSPVTRALGFSLGGPSSAMGNRRTAFGHAGTGGAIGFADPDFHFALGLTKNRLVSSPPGEGSAITVARAIRHALGIPEE